MKTKLQHWRDRFDALTLRERALVALMVLSAIYVVWDMAVMQALHKTQKVQLDKIEKSLGQIAELNKQISVLTAGLKQSDSTAAGSDAGKLQLAINESDKRIESLIYSFVRPEQMAKLLRELLQRENGLHLMRVRTQAVRSLFDGGSQDKATAAFDDGKFTAMKKLLKLYKVRKESGLLMEMKGSVVQESVGKGVTGGESSKSPASDDELPEIYRHGLEIEFVGDFSGTVGYLRAIEALPWRLYWDSVSYTVQEHPRALVKIKLYTLSLDKGWIGV